MKCNKCGSEWNSKVKQDNCPFCGSPLESAAANDTVVSVLQTLIINNGFEVLKKPNYLKSYILDCVVGQETEKKMFSFACNFNLLDVLYEIVLSDEPEQRRVLVMKGIRTLEDDALMSEQHACDILRMLLDAANCADDCFDLFVTEEPQKKSSPLPQERKQGLYSLRIDRLSPSADHEKIAEALSRQTSIVSYLWKDVLSSLPCTALDNMSYSDAKSLYDRLGSMGCVLTVAEQSESVSPKRVILQRMNNQNKIQTIKAFRECTGFGLADAKDRVENCPSMILENVPEDVARIIENKFRAVGASVQIV